MDLIIETERLILREMLHEDAEALFEMDRNPAVHIYLWQKPYATIQEIHNYINLIRNQYETQGIGRFSTIEKETNRLIGWTGIKFINNIIENGKTDFYDYGYRLNENSWNKGYATEASKAWLEYGFKQMNIEVMNAYTHAQNGASNHVLQKLGFNCTEEYQNEDSITWKWWEMKNPFLTKL